MKPLGNFKVCVCGGAGGIGQPLSLVMGMDPDVMELCMSDLNVDMVPPVGGAQDLAHLERKCSVKDLQLKDAAAAAAASECAYSRAGSASFRQGGPPWSRRWRPSPWCCASACLAKQSATACVQAALHKRLKGAAGSASARGGQLNPPHA